MTARVLHVLSQRPSRTGSGVTLEAMATAAAARGWDQAAVVGTPAQDPTPHVIGVDADRIYPLVFGRGALPFALPGMSDVMPYETSRFSALSADQIERYRDAWRVHLADVIDRERPDVIHSHHVWLVSALIKDVAPSLPVVTHCHATGLRQMALCPHLADDVRRGVTRNDALLALHAAQAAELARTLGMEDARSKISVISAGYRDDVFHARGRQVPTEPRVLYVGKLSRAKGVPWLVRAIDVVARQIPEVTLDVVGGGAGDEADALRAELAAFGARVRVHGRVSQDELVRWMRACAVFALPSLYEGLPLVLVEAAACGARVVATALPGVADALGPGLGDVAAWVPPPRLRGVDVPEPGDEDRFVAALARALSEALARGPRGDPPDAIAARVDSFRWGAVFARVEAVYRRLLSAPTP